MYWNIGIKLCLTAVLLLLEGPTDWCTAAGSSKFIETNPNAPSSKGNEFVLGFMSNGGPANIAKPNVVLFVATNEEEPVTFTVQNPQLNINETHTTVAGKAAAVILPTDSTRKDKDVRVSDGEMRDKGIHVKAEGNKKISVYGLNDEDVSTDAFLALPCVSYDEQAPTSFKYYIFSGDVEGTSELLASRFLIVPCEDNTSVTIVPNQALQIPADISETGFARSIDFDHPGKLTVHRLQTIMFDSPNDLTGTILESNNPLSVFSGHECAHVPIDETACDHLVEQVPPHITYGRTYLTAPLAFRESGERFRVGSLLDGNQINVTCTTEGMEPRPVATNEVVNRGMFYQFETVKDPTDGQNEEYKRDFCCIESELPVTVMQYMMGHSVDKIFDKGDPSMVIVAPVSQYLNEFGISTSKELRGPADFTSYISYTLPVQFFNGDEDADNFLINGTKFEPRSGYSPIYCSDDSICGYGAYTDLPKAEHLVRYNKSRAGMYLFVYGVQTEVSFECPAGFELEPIGMPQIEIPDVTVNENVGIIEIEIRRTGGDLSTNSKIVVGSRNGSATAHSDYVPVARTNSSYAGHLMRFKKNLFTPRSEDILKVMIIDDDKGEPTETFEIYLIEVIEDAYVVKPVGTITILDNDALAELLVVEWEVPKITVDEDIGLTEACFSPNATSTIPITVTVGVAPKSDHHATRNEDYRINPRDLVFVINESSEAGQRFCVPITIIDDTITLEREELFRLFFDGLPSSDVGVGEIAEVCVSIIDNEAPVIEWEVTDIRVPEGGPDPEICYIINSAIGDKTDFTIHTALKRNSSHPATAESDYTPVSLQVVVGPTSGPERACVTVPIIDDNLANEADEPFSIQFNVSGSPLVVGANAEACVTIIDNDDLVVEWEVPNITINEDGGETKACFSVSTPSAIPITITVGVDPKSKFPATRDEDYSIRANDLQHIINESTEAGQRFCVPISIIDDTITLEREEQIRLFFDGLPSSAVGVGDIAEVCVSIIDDIRIIRNATIIGDPLYTVPFTPSFKNPEELGHLCYEVRGHADTVFNLVSDKCVNVNAYYSSMKEPTDGNVISQIAMRAASNSDQCYNIHVARNGCIASMSSQSSNLEDFIRVEDRFSSDGISIRKYAERVRITVPNCENVMLVMWVICETRNDQAMIKFVIARGIALRQTSHGLIGQFWNVEIQYENVTSELPAFIVNPEDYRIISVPSVTTPGESRHFIAELHHRTWDKTPEQCYYTGDSQGGHSGLVVSPDDSVIEGNYKEYILDGLFATDYRYGQYEEENCAN